MRTGATSANALVRSDDDLVSAPTIDALDVASLRPVLTAESTGTEGVKDPYVMTVGPTLLMFASYAASIPMTPEARADAHSTGDIYARGVTTAPTGLATSLDGRRFDCFLPENSRK